MKLTLKDIDFKYGDAVIVRVDYNLPKDSNGEISDWGRLYASASTINYLQSLGAKIVLLSHRDKIKKEEDLIKNSLRPALGKIQEVFKTKVYFSTEAVGEEVITKVENLNPGEILLIENIRSYDLNGKLESKNDATFAKELSKLGKIFVVDGFGSIHRAHASTAGIAEHLPTYSGFLVEQETSNLDWVVKNPKRPLTVIFGGAKMEDKIPSVEKLAETADYIILTGGMANTFLKAKKYNIGMSIHFDEHLELCRKLLAKYGNKILLPNDVVVENKEEGSVTNKLVTDIKDGDNALDIGSITIDNIKKIIKNSGAILWNGPAGMFEVPPFDSGTKAICAALQENETAIKYCGGGDTATAVKSFGYADLFTVVSTGGGATFAYLSGEVQPGLARIEEAPFVIRNGIGDNLLYVSYLQKYLAAAAHQYPLLSYLKENLYSNFFVNQNLKDISTDIYDSAFIISDEGIIGHTITKISPRGEISVVEYNIPDNIANVWDSYKLQYGRRMGYTPVELGVRLKIKLN